MNIYFLLTGFENQIPFHIKFTFTDLAMDLGIHKGSEIFYSLTELHLDEIENMKVGNDPIMVRLSRDNKKSIGLLVRTNFETFKNTKDAL
jgi:hypothetical protein